MLERTPVKKTTEKAYAIRELRPLKKHSYRGVMRTFEIIVSGLFLLCVSPVILILMLAIVIDDPNGSPIFKQIRIGRAGKPFYMYKLRSMRVDAEALLVNYRDLNEMDGPVFKIKNDPRITRMGKFIRATSLDELPQFYNVLKGDMAIVGPRPPLPNEVKEYTEYDYQRLYVTPGLTCFWQIAPKRNDLSFAQWVELDIKYIVERSLWVDIKMMFNTALAMVRRDGR